ncbi:MAG: class I SAM-dependent methyltransferase [Polyangiaceae bacterium]|nr:class I SAM-dependent methyltransferase [Polyangiaceae bacterium]
MKRSLVSFLRDPDSGERLSLTNAPDGDEIDAGILKSESGAEYRISGGVPGMVREDKFAEGQKETVESFSWKWEKAKHYRKTTEGHYVKWYLDRYGFGTEENLAKLLEGKKNILDAGTAHGRDAEMYVRNSKATVFGIDISYGIRNAYRDIGHLPSLHLVQADLTRLPFPENFFDFIGCDQVIHHTPNTRTSLGHLVTRLAPGGHIAFYVYKKKGPVREFCDDHIRAQTVHMSPEECMKVSEAITKLGKALSDLKVTVDVPEDIPILGIKAGKQDIQRFIYWNMFKCYWNDTMDWDANVITNFDWYHPLHAHRHTLEEVKQWCAELGLEIQHVDVQESGISTLAKKSA